MSTVGSFEAKTKLAELLDKVEAGEPSRSRATASRSRNLFPSRRMTMQERMRALIEEIKRTRVGRDRGASPARRSRN
jgi:hypothetical protein